MSGVQQRLKLKQTPIDTWSLKEQLTLASAVLRTGDQNWVSVSRTMKQFWEPGRPPDWYSQKNCALQYNLIMEKADLPRRKRGEKLEGRDSPGQTIVTTLADQRKSQLRDLLQEEKVQISKLEQEVQLLSSDNVTEEQMQKIIKEIEEEEREEDRREEEHILFIKQRDEKKSAIQAALKTGLYYKQGGAACASEQSGSEVDSAVDSPAPADEPDIEIRRDISEVTETERQEGGADSNPLLTSLLQSKPVQESDTQDDVRENTTEVVEAEKPVEVKEEKADEPAKEEPKIIVVDSPGKKEEEEIEVPELKEPIKSEEKKEEIKMDTDIDQEDEDINDAEEITDSHQDEAPPEEKEDPVKEEVTEEEIKVKEEVKEEMKETIKEEEPEEEKKAEEETPPPATAELPPPESAAPIPAPAVVVPTEPEIKITPRRGRPRSKKTLEAEAETANSSRASSPVTRTTSPSPEVTPRSKSREGGTGSRRSSRPGTSSKSRGRDGLDSTPASPGSVTHDDDSRDNKAWKKSILMVLDQIAQHKHASLFAAPVSEAEAPEYKEIVLQPVDLGTIKKNIESGVTRCTEEFQRDLAHMFVNAIMYNSSDHDVYRFTLDMHRDTDTIIKEFLHTQALLKANEAPKLRVKEIIENPGRTRTGSGSFTPEDRKKPEDKRKRTSTSEEYPAAKKRRLRNLDD